MDWKENFLSAHEGGTFGKSRCSRMGSILSADATDEDLAIVGPRSECCHAEIWAHGKQGLECLSGIMVKRPSSNNCPRPDTWVVS